MDSSLVGIVTKARNHRRALVSIVEGIDLLLVVGRTCESIKKRALNNFYGWMEREKKMWGVEGINFEITKKQNFS